MGGTVADVTDIDRLDDLFHRPPVSPAWIPRPVERETLDELHVLLGLCPASAPLAPGHVLFIESLASRARLERHVDRMGAEEARRAPVCAVVGYDRAFAENLLCANEGAFAPGRLRDAAVRTAALQGAFLIVAARALGLEARPIAGASFPGLTREFFAGGRLQANFLCGLGYAAPPRGGDLTWRRDAASPAPRARGPDPGSS